MLDVAWTAGEPNLIESLIANLVDNAVRHNVVGGQVMVTTATINGAATVSITNSGVERPSRPAPAPRAGSPWS
ncbi:MAG TPA: ATP-binding protein [Acidimicrobiales bacterium]|nr:ATP-binding protein [Acidimicrobiales bacterium]